MSIVDQQEFSVTCDHCGNEIVKTIGWLKNNCLFTCRCGVTDTFADRAQMLAKFGWVDKPGRDLDEGMNNGFKLDS